MNPTNMPGFTADKSVYKATGHYRLLAISAGETNAHIGPAQFALPIPQDGDGGQSCLPRFLGCLPDPDDPNDPPGCRRYFRRRDCSEVPLGSCQCPTQPTTCGPCVGVRQCSDGTQRPCSV